MCLAGALAMAGCGSPEAGADSPSITTMTVTASPATITVEPGPTASGSTASDPSVPGLTAADPTAADPGPTAAPPPVAPGPAGGSLAGVVVVVDPGHNGGNAAHPSQISRQVDAGGFSKDCNTTGTAGRSQSEPEFTWALAQTLAAQLRERGATVVLTRDSNTGVGPCIDERGKLARSVGAAVLVSVHADGAGPSQHGFHVIYPGERAGYTDGVVQPSRQLASGVRDALVANGFSPSTYAGRSGLDERDDLGTLNWAGVPAVMLEAGNMRNSGDDATLASADGQARIADALADAVQAQFGR